MNKLTEHRFVDLYDISSGISTTKEQAGHGYPFVSFSTVFNNYFLPETLPDLMDTSEQERITYSVKKGDIFLTRTSETFDELAMSSVALKDYPDATFSGFVKRLRPKTNGIAYAPYLGFYLRGYLFRRAVTNHSILTLRASFNEDIFSFLKLYLPEYEQQKEIGDFLYLLEKKIQLNNAINAELESIARTLYDYWFTQFDFPDKNGKPYRASGGMMVWNEELKQEIPKGWKVVTLRDVLDNITEGTKPGEHLKGLFYSPLDVIPTRKMSFYGGQSYESANSSLLLYKENDILLGAMRVHFHRVCISAHDGITRSTTIVLRPKKNGQIPFLFQVINSEKTIAHAVNLSGKSQQPYINWEGELENYKFAIPCDEQLVLHYSKHVSSLISRVKNNERENYELAAFRNFLLPLLMNGQVTAAGMKLVASDPRVKREAAFKRLVLSAYILDNICDEPTAGRVKFEKLLYLSEYCAEIDLHSDFHRHAAGPYDPKALYSIEQQLEENKWFGRNRDKTQSRAYVRLGKSNDYKPYVEPNLQEKQKSVIDRLIHLFRTARTIQCEIVATLYGAWNDFLIEGVQPTDDRIVNEVLTNWHKRKERIDRQRWLEALGWMRQNDIIPVGYGASTKAS